MPDLLLLSILAVLLFAAVWLPLRPRWPYAALPACGALLVAPIVLWKLSSVRAAVLGPTVLRVQTDAPLVALTFDDGPTPAYTNPVLDALDAGAARATFFVTGAELTASPALGEAIRARGHELGNHSWSHPRLIFGSSAWLASEVERTDAAIRAVGQTGPIPFRPPYGKRLLGLHGVLGARPVVLWDVEPESWPEVAATPGRLAEHVLEHVRPGSIVLLHAMYGSRQTTRDALPQILAGLRERGLRSVPVSELLAAAPPTGAPSRD